jgi:predicted porin
MNKKLLIAAVGAALAAAPMLAAQAAPTVYGSFHMSLDRFDVDGATTSTERGLLNSNSSRFGLKGDEDLGGGLKSIYQVESGVFNADTGAGGLSDTLRNTYLGFAGSSWGSVKFGRHDTPVKDLSRAIDMFNEQIGDSRNVIGNIGSFDARISNMVRYDSPDFSGIKFALQYGTPEAANATRYTSANGTWTSGPFMLGLGYETHSFGGAVVTGTTTQKKEEKDIRLVGKFTMDALTFSALYEMMSDLNGVSDADRNAWGLGAGFKMANNLLKFQYYTTDKVDKQATENGGKIWALGVDHSMSKTTMVYADYAVASNDGGTQAFNVATSSPGGHGQTNQPLVGKNGGDSKAYSFGTIIKF